jgi:hypothetical protein
MSKGFWISPIQCQSQPAPWLLLLLAAFSTSY